MALVQLFVRAGIGSSLFAGLGLAVLRIGSWVYVEGTWLDRDAFEDVYEHVGMNPIRVPERLIRCKNGRTIETTLDTETLRWIFNKPVDL